MLVVAFICKLDYIATSYGVARIYLTIPKRFSIVHMPSHRRDNSALA